MRCDFVSRATSIRFCCWSNVQHVLYLLDIIYFSLWANDPIHNSSSPLPFIEIHLLHHLQMYMMHIISTRRNLLYLGYGVVFSFSLQPPCCVLSAPCKIKIDYILLAWTIGVSVELLQHFTYVLLGKPGQSANLIVTLKRESKWSSKSRV